MRRDYVGRFNCYSSDTRIDQKSEVKVLTKKAVLGFLGNHDSFDLSEYCDGDAKIANQCKNRLWECTNGEDGDYEDSRPQGFIYCGSIVEAQSTSPLSSGRSAWFRDPTTGSPEKEMGLGIVWRFEL